jgi:type VI secretion system protein ImpA
MPVATIEDLLQPISEANPSGTDQSGEPEWQALKEARRSDDKFNRGSWDRPLKEADWHEVEEICVQLLTRKTKDLRLAVFLTEARLNLNEGFTGLADSLRLMSGLISDYWDTGLFPALEEGDAQYRAQALDWLGEPEKLPTAIHGITVTKRSDGGEDYSWTNFEDARTVGWEKDLKTPTGDVDDAKAHRRATLLSGGHISREMFELALSSTSRAAIEQVSQECAAAWAEFMALDKVVDQKFGAQGPGLQAAREAFEDCRSLIQECQNKKREQEPDQVASSTSAAQKPSESSDVGALAGIYGDEGGASGSTGSWQAAESLVRAGNLKEGLAEMTRLAASEHGRIRFHRKLRLAETCFSIKRDRLAIAILEELAKEIDEHHLESWESAELLGRVWGRLYRSYKSGDEATARAAELFDRLCRLDPWQALRWED